MTNEAAPSRELLDCLSVLTKAGTRVWASTERPGFYSIEEGPDVPGSEVIARAHKEGLLYTVGRPTTSSGFWFCDVLRDGKVYCNVAYLLSEEYALERAKGIAKALNVAGSLEYAGAAA